MEGMGLFNIAGTGGDGNMRTAVHTRRIVDPIYGSKLTGTLGRTTFGILNAVDDNPTPPSTVEGEPVDVPYKVTTVGRATYGLRRSDYVGGIFTHTQHDGRHNLVAGGDVSVRPSDAHAISATFLTSRTGGRDAADVEGHTAQAMYVYSTRRLFSITQGEHYDKNFVMDTAFYNRTGFTSAWSFSELNFYPKSSWLQRVYPFYFVKYGRDRIQDGPEDFVHTGIRFSVTRQGFFNFSHGRGHESWKGTKYRVGSDFNFFGGIQALRWLNLGGNYGGGPAIFYDEVAHYQGRARNYGVDMTVQPNQHLSQSVDFSRNRFWRPETGAEVYAVNIVNSRTTYQFDKHFLVRMLARYDSSQRRVLTDFLGSYEFVPGTVFHAGYGALFEKGFGSVEPVPGPANPNDSLSRYSMINRGLFLKASYLRRF
jgi:hypothetical protein